MTLGGCFRLLRKSRINAMRKRRRRNTFFHYLLALYVVILTFGDIKNVEARSRIVTSGRNRGINLIERESKRITSRQLDGNQFIREVSDVDSNTTASSATNRTHPKASEIANKAAIEAKAASDAQILAGRQAAHQVKVQLANKAAQSAKAAEAALAGKVALIEQLEDEARETQVVFKEGTLELERVRENTDAALKVVNSSRQKLQLLMRVVEAAKASLENAHISSDGAKITMAKKELLLEAAKRRVSELKRRLQIALDELSKTREYTEKAMEAAKEARAKRKSTNIARNAAEQAKAASDAQNVAAAQASRQVKAQLAERAEMAAKAAEAALAGKETLVAQLQQELREAEAVVQEETASLNQTKIHTSSSHLTQDDEREQLKLLNQALQMVSGNIQISDRAAQGAQFELMEKEQLMEAAKRRLDQLTRRLKIAQKDLDNTKTLVMKANAAARDARLNAERNKRLSDSTS